MLSNTNKTDLGGCQMKKEKVLKNAAIEWLVLNNCKDVNKLLETVLSTTYTEK
ncbi:hypothetical protein IIO_00139 [Bacillus cereus VD115]|nr:hypothetical protein IIO_00139 [Bacillus cereus VD115]